MQGLELNKIAASVLVAGLVAMTAGKIADALYHGSISPGHGHETEAKRGYTIAGAEEAADPHAAPAAEEKPVDILPLLAAANPEAGKAQLKKCTACHTFEKGGKHGVGPNQWNLIGRNVASVEGYAYSTALQGMKDKRWGFQELSDFLANPKKVAPGNKMAFAGIKKPEDRADLIAYLNSLSDSPQPLPKP